MAAGSNGRHYRHYRGVGDAGAGQGGGGGTSFVLFGVRSSSATSPFNDHLPPSRKRFVSRMRIFSCVSSVFFTFEELLHTWYDIMHYENMYSYLVYNRCEYSFLFFSLPLSHSL